MIRTSDERLWVSQRPVFIVLAAVGALGLLLTGCRSPAGPSLSGDRVQLRNRALALLQRAAESPLPVVRANALEALVDVAPRQSLPLFRGALKSANPLVRYAACVALGDVRDRASVEAFRRLVSSADHHVRIGAAYAAYRCGLSGAARILVDALNNDPDEKIRADAAFLIGKLGESKAIKRLRLAMRREKSTYVQVHIVAAMATLGDDESLDALIYYTQSDITSRIIALQTLERIAAPRARGALLRLLNDDQTYVQIRLLAARALGRLGDRSGLQLCLRHLTYKADKPEETRQVRVNAALALGAMRSAKALPALEKLAGDQSDPQVQVAAAYAICQICR